MSNLGQEMCKNLKIQKLCFLTFVNSPRNNQNGTLCFSTTCFAKMRQLHWTNFVNQLDSFDVVGYFECANCNNVEMIRNNCHNSCFWLSDSCGSLPIDTLQIHWCWDVDQQFVLLCLFSPCCAMGAHTNTGQTKGGCFLPFLVESWSMTRVLVGDVFQCQHSERSFPEVLPYQFGTFWIVSTFNRQSWRSEAS